jgi:hypothetical protein
MAKSDQPGDQQHTALQLLAASQGQLPSSDTNTLVSSATGKLMVRRRAPDPSAPSQPVAWLVRAWTSGSSSGSPHDGLRHLFGFEWLATPDVVCGAHVWASSQAARSAGPWKSRSGGWASNSMDLIASQTSCQVMGKIFELPSCGSWLVSDGHLKHLIAIHLPHNLPHRSLRSPAQIGLDALGLQR